MLGIYIYRYYLCPIKQRSLVAAARRSGFSFFAMLCTFDSSSPLVNVFNSQLATFAAKGNSVKRCWTLEISSTARILGEEEVDVFHGIPTTGEFMGELSVNGQKRPIKVSYPEFSFPLVS